MNDTVKTTNTDDTAVKPVAKYLQQRAKRQRFSFGPAWAKAVLDGAVSDKDKLVAHAVKLKAGRRADLSKLKFATLLAKVQTKLTAASTPTAE